MANLPAPNDMTVFDRAAVRRHRDRAATALDQHDFLLREVADRLAERLGDVRRGFSRALVLGGHGGVVRRAVAGRGGLEFVVECDLSPAMAALHATTAPMKMAETAPMGLLEPNRAESSKAEVRIVAIVTPEIGLLDEPTRPAI